MPIEERPGERSDFQIPDLVSHVRTNRHMLVAAGLTILRAHLASGKGDSGLTKFGSFESWSKVVRGAVFQATGHDPCATREVISGGDPDQARDHTIVEAWASLAGGDAVPGLTVGEAMEFARSNHQAHVAFVEALRDACGPDLNTRSIGRHLAKIRDRTLGGKALRFKKIHNQAHYWVEPIAAEKAVTETAPPAAQS